VHDDGETPRQRDPRLAHGLRKVFETTVQRCLVEGWVGGEAFAVDASMIKADANRQRGVPGSEWQAPETAKYAVREVLDNAAYRPRGSRSTR